MTSCDSFFLVSISRDFGVFFSSLIKNLVFLDVLPRPQFLDRGHTKITFFAKSFWVFSFFFKVFFFEKVREVPEKNSEKS